MSHVVSYLGLVGMIALFSGIECTVKRRPVLIRYEVIAGIVGCGAGMNLVQVFGNVQTITVHANITRAHCRSAAQLPLDRQVPLRRLGVAIVRIYALVQSPAPIGGA